MKRVTVTVLMFLFVFSVGFILSSSSVWAAGNAAGKKVFLDAKCNKCHSMDSEKIAKLPKEAAAEGEDEEGGAKVDPPDLSKLDDAFLKAKGTPEDSLKAWLKKEVDVAYKGNPPAKHKKLYNGADADLTALVQFLLGK